MIMNNVMKVARQSELVARIKLYADENMLMCNDNIVSDIAFGEMEKRGEMPQQLVALSNERQLKSIYHSAKHDAAMDILELMGVTTDDI